MSLLDSFKISSSGLDAQARRVELSAQNIANISTPNYIRKVPVLVEHDHTSFESILDTLQSTGSVVEAASSYEPRGVQVEQIVADTTPGEKVYNPQHPDADAQGYITMSNTNILGDMTDAIVSQRMYEANMAVISITKTMANRAVDLGRGG